MPMYEYQVTRGQDLTILPFSRIFRKNDLQNSPYLAIK